MYIVYARPCQAPPVFGIPGLDVFCYSNGNDWARGLRSQLRHATNGGVSMLLDSTALLARRHVDMAARDGAWQFRHPAAGEELEADAVVLYAHGASTADALTISAEVTISAEAAAAEAAAAAAAPETMAGARLAVATYGNGVVKALEAISRSQIACDVIDCPLLSRCPDALAPLLRAKAYDGLLLVDVCREVSR